jgi:hypothetical protein
MLVTEVGEMRTVTLTLERDVGLLGLRVKLFDDTIHKLGKIECLAVDLYAGPETGEFEELVGEPQ